MKAFTGVQDELQRLRQTGNYRSRRLLESAQQVRLRVDGRQVVNFCSNDYLGLARHPDVLQAFKQAADCYGVGSGSAHLICGHSRAHHQLEEELADFTGRDRALLFSTGYMANLAVLTTLLNRKSVVFEDRLNHASLLDGGLFSGAGFKRYPHGDTASLDKLLSETTSENRMIVSDAVFSMDGDIAPLRQLAQLGERYQAGLMVDDAHGFGVLGEKGKGTLEACQLTQADVPLLMGTLGKALGSFGAFVAGSEALIEYLLQKARTYIYTTALPPAIAEATRTSLQLLDAESWRRQVLFEHVRRFRRGARQLGLSVMASKTPIQPVLIGDSGKAVAVSQALFDLGLWVSAIRPPTVPMGQARLRITLSAEHKEHDIDQLLDGLDRVLA